MKSIYGLAFFLTVVSFSFGQDNTHVRIHLKTDSLVKRIELTNYFKTVLVEKPYSDSIILSLNCKSPDQFKLTVETENKKFDQGFWLDSAEIKISAALVKDLRIDTIAGSRFHDYSKKFFKVIRETNDPQELKSLYYKNIVENIGNSFSLTLVLLYLNEIQDDKQKLTDLKTLLSTIPESMKLHPLYGIDTTKLNSLIDIKTLNFQKYTFLNDKKAPSKILLGEGKFAILDFWFSSYAPCIHDHEEMKKNAELLKTKNVEVVGISTDKVYADWLKYLKGKKITWSNYLIDPSSAADISKDLGVQVFPTYVLINDHGKILRNFTFFKEIISYLEKR